jgi:hypothetical protein
MFRCATALCLGLLLGCSDKPASRARPGPSAAAPGCAALPAADAIAGWLEVEQVIADSTGEAAAPRCFFREKAGLVELSVALDCRAEHPRFAALKQSLGPSARLVDIGLGGAQVAMPEAAGHKLSFEAERPSCAVYLVLKGKSATALEQVARHIAAALARFETRT